MRAGLKVSISGFVLATLLPMARVHNRWIRMLEFPRLQLALWGLVNLAWGCVMPRKGPRLFWNLVNTACLLHQARSLFPFTILKPVETRAAPVPVDLRNTVKILIYNVLMTNRNVDDFWRMIAREDPDLILLNEPDQWWEGQLQDLERAYGYQVKVPQDNTYGMLLYSRLALSDTRVDRRREQDVPSIHAIVELPSGKKIRFLAVHPRPPAEEDTDERDAELDEVAREVKGSDLPCIVAGDMNDVAWSRTTRTFQQRSGTLDPRVGRGFFNTFHAHIPFVRYSLDHVFHTPEFNLVELRRMPKSGSDHFPILIHLGLSSGPRVS